MRDPLTPDEDAVFIEFKRRDVKPGEEAEIIDQIAESCNISYQRARKAAQELFKKGYLYIDEDEKEQEEELLRKILYDLLLHDIEIRKMLKKIVEETIKAH